MIALTCTDAHVQDDHSKRFRWAYEMRIIHELSKDRHNVWVLMATIR
jgi:hypothetical protein